MADGTTVGGWLTFLFVAAGCNAIFGLDAGKPRPAGSAGKAGAASGASGRGGAGNAPGSGGDSGEGGEVNAGNGGGAGKAGSGGAVGGAGAGATGGATGGVGASAGASAGGRGGTSGAPGGEAGIAGTATDGGEGGQPGDPRPVASVWALWKMPNPAGSGLPNPADYDTQTPGVVLDKVTGLMWQRAPSTPRNWDEAVIYCNDLQLADFDDFRMPSRIELVSIVDFTTSPTIDPAAFPDTPETLYWTSSPWPDTIGNGVYIVHFIGGYTSVSDRAPATTLRVRCVR